MKKLLFAMMAIVLLISACSKEAAVKPKTVVSVPKIKVGESYAAGSGIKVTMYQDTTFLTQYNRVYLVLTDSVSGAAISTASMSMAASMPGGMMGMPMVCPVMRPTYNSSSSMYVGACVFTMPNSAMAQWDVTISVTNPTTGKMGNADFMVKVDNAKYNLTTTVTGSDGQTYTISLVQPLKPHIGMNTLELMVDQETMVMNMTGMYMSYAPVNNFTVAFTPSMAAMGNMPSNGNVTPEFDAVGSYVGKVNLAMAGEWKLNIDLMNGQTKVVNGASLDFKF